MGVERVPVQSDLAVGDRVRVLQGPLESFEGVIEELFADSQKARGAMFCPGWPKPRRRAYRLPITA